MPAVFSRARISASASRAGPEMSNSLVMTPATGGIQPQGRGFRRRAPGRGPRSRRGCGRLAARRPWRPAALRFRRATARCAVALAQPLQQGLDIAGAPEMPLQPRAPLRAAMSSASTSAPNSARSPNTQFEILQARGAQRFERQRQDFASRRRRASSSPSNSTPAWKNWVGRCGRSG